MTIAEDSQMAEIFRLIAEEGCLSLVGFRKTTRYKEITVEYRDMNYFVRISM